MVFESEPREGTYLESIINDLVSKNHFLDFDQKELENINKKGQRVSKYDVKIWAKNVCDEWRVFHGLDMTRSIAHISKDVFC